MNVIQFSSPSLPPYSYKEIARYMRANAENEDIKALIDQCIVECEGKITGKVIYRELPISCSEKELDLGFAKVKSKDLGKLLLNNNCHSIILFAATVGIGIDRLILKHSRLSPAKALCFQAIGAERVEALCDAFSLELKGKFESRGMALTPRFSPGYGDLPLTLQREIFANLDCEKNLGITLNTSLLMTPTKSVTAIIGIKGYKENT